MGGLRSIDHPCAEAMWIYFIERTLLACCVCPRHGDENSVSTAVLPTDVAFQAPRVENYNEENSDKAQLVELDNLEEERLVTCVWTAKYVDGLRRYYNCNVDDRFFVVVDLVLRSK